MDIKINKLTNIDLSWFYILYQHEFMYFTEWKETGVRFVKITYIQ